MKTKTQKRKTKKNLKKTMKNNYKRNNHRGGKKSRKSVKLEKLNCSPKPKSEINDFSCYTNKSLYKLRDMWNARHPDVKIISNTPKEIHREISEKLYRSNAY